MTEPLLLTFILGTCCGLALALVIGEVVNARLKGGRDG